MRISELFSLGMEYLIWGLTFVAVLGVGAFLVSVLYRKKYGNSRKLPLLKLALHGVLICYLVVVFGATTLSRAGFYEDAVRLQLFYSYRDAWNDFSMTEWRNIILNILMFVPLGVLMPLTRCRFRKAGWTYLAGLVLTAVIEMVQLVLKRGIFEMDDLLNNLLGTMIGYGVYRVCEAVCGVVAAGAEAGGQQKVVAGGAEAGGQQNVVLGGAEAGGQQKVVLGGAEAGGQQKVVAGGGSNPGAQQNTVRGRQVKEKKKQSGRWLAAAAYQLPLVLTVAAFLGIFTIYNRQELGNLHSEYIVRQKVNYVTTDLEFSEEETCQPVYRVSIAGQEETRQQAVDFFARFGSEVDDSQTDIYENTIIYRSADSKSLWIEYKGSTYNYTDFELQFGEDAPAVNTDAEAEVVLQALERLQIKLPEGMIFERSGERYCFTADMILQDGLLYDGTIECEYTEDDRIAGLRNTLLVCRPYKDFTVISEAEAYGRLQAGEFYYPKDEEWNIEIYDAYLAYEMDSKGFYQPVYRFDVRMNAYDGYIIIPAIEK